MGDIANNSAIVTYVLCILILLNAAFGNAWQLRVKRNTNKYLVAMFFLILASCIADMTFYVFFGRSDVLSRAMLLVINTLLYVTEVAACYVGLAFMMEVQRSRCRSELIVAALPALVELVTMIVNVFVPIVFIVTPDGGIERGELHAITAVIAVGYAVAGFISYFAGARRGGLLGFFSVWSVIAPVCFALFSDLVLGSISLAWCAMAIALDGVLAAFQKEATFRDPLTGLHNRLFLSQLCGRSNLKGVYAHAILLDLDAFKSINDTFGHDVGDDALIQMSRVLEQAVGSTGLAFRYAGDEFFVLTKANQQRSVDSQVQAIEAGLEHFNKGTKKPYRLSASFGSCAIDSDLQSLSDVLKVADKAMYENKALHYQSIGFDRRKSRA